MDNSLIRKGLRRFDNSNPNIDKLMKKFWGRDPAEDARVARLARAHTVVFQDWAWIDYRKTYKSKSIAEEMETDPTLSDREKRVLAAVNASHMSAYQVIHVDKGLGVELENILEGGRVFVHDYNLSLSVSRWLITFCRVYPAGPYHFGAGASFAFPPDWKEYIRAHLELELEKYEDGHLRAGWHEFLKAKAEVFGHLAVELHRKMEQPPKLANYDGEPIVLCTCHYEIENPGEYLTALRNCKKLEEEESEDELCRFVWVKQKEHDRILLGRVEVNGNKLKLECNSLKRKARWTKLLESLGRLKYIGGEEKPGDQLVKEAWLKGGQSKDTEESSKVLAPELREVMAQSQAEHYGHWPDSPLPALGGLTPKQAVKTPAGRQRVIDLIRGIEYSHRQSKSPYDISYDWNKLRRNLGLPEE